MPAWAQALRRTRSRLLVRSSVWVAASAATAPGLDGSQAKVRLPRPAASWMGPSPMRLRSFANQAIQNPLLVVTRIWRAGAVP